MLWGLPFNWKTKQSLISVQRKKLVGLSQWFSEGVILLPNQLALSGGFFGVRVWGQGGHQWCLVSKGWECLLLHTQHWCFTNLTMHRTAPHTENDPAQFVNSAKKNSSVCPPLLPPFLPVLTPLILPPKHFPPQLLLHTPLFSSCLCPFSLIITSTTDRATKSGNVARKEGICGEKVPSKVWEMWFPIRLSKL